MTVLDAVTVLSYRNTVTGPDSITDVAASALASADTAGIPCRLAVETQDLGPDPVARKQTFHGLGKAALDHALGEVDRDARRRAGVRRDGRARLRALALALERRRQHVAEQGVLVGNGRIETLARGTTRTRSRSRAAGSPSPAALPTRSTHLRQVDDDEPVAGGEQVVRRQVAVHDAVLGHQGECLAQLLEVPRAAAPARVGSAPAAEPSRRRTAIHSIRISVPSICTG